MKYIEDTIEYDMLDIVINCLVFVGLIVWGFFAIRGAYKKKDKELSCEQ